MHNGDLADGSDPGAGPQDAASDGVAQPQPHDPGAPHAGDGGLLRARNLLLGHQAIDAEHAHLLDLMARFEQLDGDADHARALGQAACDLVEFVRIHFEHEEELMRASGFPDAPRHRRDHDSVTQKLTLYLYRLALSPATAPPPGIAETLQNWYVSHLETFDRPMAEFLLRHEPGAAAGRQRGGPSEG